MAVPKDWSVVIVGHWNRAILTPAGIAKRLFGIEPSEHVPLEVFVPMDDYGPYQVKHGGVTVTAASDRLVIRANDCTFTCLEKAKSAGVNALRDLPHTPFLAAGINVGFDMTDGEGTASQIVDHAADTGLSDAGFKITGRSSQRTVSWKEGHINVSLSQETSGEYSARLNFELKTKDGDKLIGWLGTPIEELKETVSSITLNYFGITQQELYDDKTNKD